MGYDEKLDRDGRKRKPIKTYRDLIVWQRSMALVTDIYRTTFLEYIRRDLFEVLFEKSREVERMLSSLTKKPGAK